MGSGQTLCIISNVQGHHTIRTVQMRFFLFSAVYLVSQWVDFDQTCTEIALGLGKEVIRICDLDYVFGHFIVGGHSFPLKTMF